MLFSHPVSTVLAGLSLSLSLSGTAARADEVEAAVLHAPVPLYGFDWPGFWPRGMEDPREIGCASRVAFGDWQFTPDPANDEEGHWHRFANYGVFHCAALVSIADDRKELDGASSRHGFFVRLGTARKDGDVWELWAIQQGMVPGSDYSLLARREADGGLIDRFTVLQQRCPPDTVRETAALLGWRTRYCAIDSRAALLALARAMLRLPPRGTIERRNAAG